jgi:hypothetical protein
MNQHEESLSTPHLDEYLRRKWLLSWLMTLIEDGTRERVKGLEVWATVASAVYRRVE